MGPPPPDHHRSPTISIYQPTHRHNPPTPHVNNPLGSILLPDLKRSVNFVDGDVAGSRTDNTLDIIALTRCLVEVWCGERASAAFVETRERGREWDGACLLEGPRSCLFPLISTRIYRYMSGKNVPLCARFSNARINGSYVSINTKNSFEDVLGA